MFLCDAEFRSRLEELDIAIEGADYPFNAEERIQPASIDLSLSNVFWKPKRRYSKNRFFALDLRSGPLNDIGPRRYWRRQTLGEGETITLNPGDALLARTHEKFSIPVDCAGLLFGRSSFSRIGLSISCSGNFINPGYRGHMPLQLVNNGSYKIKLLPYLPICQLCLVPLISKPEKPYGHPDLQSKYMDDDGGPSYWWRDARVRKLIEKMRGKDLSLDRVHQISKLISEKDLSIVDRLERFLMKARVDYLSIEEILILFAAGEKKRATARTIVKYCGVAALPIALAIVGIFFRTGIQNYEVFSIAYSIVGVSLGLVLTILGYAFEIGPHLSHSDAEKMAETA